MAQLYDCLGIIAHVDEQAKILTKNLWLLLLDWDDNRNDIIFAINFPASPFFCMGRYAFLVRYFFAELHPDSKGRIQVNFLVSKRWPPESVGYLSS